MVASIVILVIIFLFSVASFSIGSFLYRKYRKELGGRDPFPTALIVIGEAGISASLLVFLIYSIAFFASSI